MKNIYLAAFACLVLFACSNNDKAEEKKVMDDILATHEKVMAAEDKAMNNKMHLDSLLKIDQFPPAEPSLKSEFKTQSAKLSAADDAMSNWMQKFDPDYKGTSHTDVMNYLTTQRKQINQIDLQLSEAIDQSGKALSKYKK